MKPETAAALDLLVTRFPTAFSSRGTRPKPLKLGIHHDLIATLMDELAKGAVSKNAIRLCLKWYARRPEYLQVLTEGGQRVDLGGNSGELVSTEHREKAKAMLAQAARAKPASQEKTASKTPKANHPWRTNVVASKKPSKVNQADPRHSLALMLVHQGHG